MPRPDAPDARTIDYHSPYGYGPVTDAALDCLADRYDIDDTDTIVNAINESGWDPDNWWRDYQGPAIDAIESALSPHLGIDYETES